MNSKLGKPQPVVNRETFDKWLTTLLEELKRNKKDKVDLMFKLYPPNFDENSAVHDHPYCCPVDTNELRLHRPVAALMNAILSDSEINMFFHEMFWQQKDLPGQKEKKIWCWQIMILLFDMVLTKAPEYNKNELRLLPFHVILRWPIATMAGFAALLNDKVNKLFKDILNYWGEFLSSPESAYTLNDDEHSGWFGKDAMEVMPNFIEEFECDPNQPHYGFTSWDDFFVRKYRPGIRPVEAPDDDSVVVNACEAAPYNVAYNVKQRDLFWIKGQHYSLDHMLNNDELARKFYGGTVYQGFLSASCYHRWHSPVSGRILKTELVDGSYFSKTHHLPADDLFRNQQAYMCHVAARGIVYILTDNPDIGLMAFISVGMSEVSSNEITVKAGDYVKKGDEIGMFHYGGSTYCMVFQPGVEITFDFHGQTPGVDKDFLNIHVRSKIAVVTKSNIKQSK